MQKQLLILGTLAMLGLSACQSIDDSTPKNSAEVEQKDKASSSSVVTITIPGEDQAEVTDTATFITTIDNENTKKRLVISEEGLSPSTLTAKAGDTLSIHNSLDKQIDLYTTATGSEPCPILSPTIEIPGQETKEIILPDVASCDIINQLNTDQKTTLTVE